MRLIRILFVFVILLAAATGGVFSLLQSYLSTSLQTSVGTISKAQIEVGDGATLRPLLKELDEKEVITKSSLLYYWARFTKQTDVRRGTYELSSSQTPDEILRILNEGRVRLESFTIAEGLNRWQIRDLLVAKSWIKKADFERLCSSKEFLKKNNIPGPSCDGYLFPETYTFARGVSGAKVMETLFANWRKNFNEAISKGNGPLNLSEVEFMTLAAIVEKETGAVEERPRIACVFYNRLQGKPRWKLQTDPTVIYAATLENPNFDGNIRRTHLREMKNPYNTYHIYGLPPGPIASPGRAALDAVAHPDECKDFFFVSKNNGRHQFCPTLDCHNAAVQKWQIDYFKKR